MVQAAFYILSIVIHQWYISVFLSLSLGYCPPGGGLPRGTLGKSHMSFSQLTLFSFSLFHGGLWRLQCTHTQKHVSVFPSGRFKAGNEPRRQYHRNHCHRFGRFVCSVPRGNCTCTDTIRTAQVPGSVPGVAPKKTPLALMQGGVFYAFAISEQAPHHSPR